MNEILKKVKKCLADCENLEIPKNPDFVEKIFGELTIGKRFCWYYKEDLDYFKEQGIDPEQYSNQIYSGIIIPIPGVENNRGELDLENIIVVIDDYPIEMDYPEVDWISLKRLLDDEDLVKFFEKKTEWTVEWE